MIEAPANGGNSITSRVVATGPINVNRYTGNSLPTRSYGVTLDSTTGTLTVDLKNNLLEHQVVTNHLSQINVIGEPAGESKRSFVLVYLQDNTTTRDLLNINFQGAANNRRMLLCIRKNPAVNTNGTNVNLNFADSASLPVWRMMSIFERTPTSWVASGGAGTITIKGGIQTNAGLAFPGVGSLVALNKETNPLYLSRYTPRLAWVETQAQ